MNDYTKSRADAKQALATKKAEVDNLLKKLLPLVEDLADPYEADWGDVGSMAQVAQELRNTVAFLSGEDE